MPRGATVNTSPTPAASRHFRSMSISDLSDDNEIEVIRTTEAKTHDGPSRRDDIESLTKETGLALKPLERWRVAMTQKVQQLGRQRVALNEKTHDQHVDFDTLFGHSSTLGQELHVVRYPWLIWVVGVLIMFGASVFVLSVHRQRAADETHGETTLWKYLVAGAVYVLGVALVANGKIESFYMNKHSAQLVVRSVKPLCLVVATNRCIERNIGHITNIRVECSGEHSGDVDTRTYTVHFDFDDGTHVTALESRSKLKTMRRCRYIKTFADVPLMQVQQTAMECVSSVVPLDPIATFANACSHK